MSQSAQASQSCCDNHAGGLPVEEARARIKAGIQPVTTRERVALRDALNRVLAEDVHSPVPVPAHDNSAMDGYAVRGQDVAGDGATELEVVGRTLAGETFDGELGSGECIRIMTGAPMPAGGDTVIMQEQADRVGDRIRVHGPHPSGNHVRRAGEDLAEGERILAAGQRIGPAELGVMASAGLVEISVFRRLRVAFFSTGDELQGVGQPLGPGQIYDSNRYTLFAAMQRLGVEAVDMGVVGDDKESLERAFREASAFADVLVTSGGVSVGEADYVKDTLDALGEVDFWKVALRPGRPLAYGRLGRALFFGLPGNPVSVMATWYQITRPALLHMMGAQPEPDQYFPVRCAEPLRKRPGRMEFQRGILSWNESGQPEVRTTGAQGSGILSSVSRANCFIVLPYNAGSVEAGETVMVQPFHGLM